MRSYPSYIYSGELVGPPHRNRPTIATLLSTLLWDGPSESDPTGGWPLEAPAWRRSDELSADARLFAAIRGGAAAPSRPTYLPPTHVRLGVFPRRSSWRYCARRTAAAPPGRSVPSSARRRHRPEGRRNGALHTPRGSRCGMPLLVCCSALILLVLAFGDPLVAWCCEQVIWCNLVRG